jgi:hypothetical protein
MTHQTLELIKEIVSGRVSSSSDVAPIPRKKQPGKKEKITINPEYKPFGRTNFRQPNDTGRYSR